MLEFAHADQTRGFFGRFELARPIDLGCPFGPRHGVRCL
jgi:hypothetical protein